MEVPNDVDVNEHFLQHNKSRQVYTAADYTRRYPLLTDIYNLSLYRGTSAAYNVHRELAQTKSVIMFIKASFNQGNTWFTLTHAVAYPKYDLRLDTFL